MKRYVVNIIVFLFATSPLYSQSGWVWQNPLPTGSHLNDCFFIDQYTGFAVGFDGIVLKSTNGGDSWLQISIGTNRTFSSVFFINDNTGYITSGDEEHPSNNILYSTTNGGLNWTNLFTFNNVHLSKIFFLNENTGFILGGRYWLGGRIFKTTNSGINWDQYSPDPTTNFVYSIYFLNEETGFVAADDGHILKTTNCGTNWISINTGFSTMLRDIVFVNDQIGFAAGYGGLIYKSTDFGETWFQLNSGSNVDLFSIKFMNGQTGFVAGGITNQNSGKLLKTTNSGSTWDSISFSDFSNFHKITASNQNQIYVLGYWGAFYKSTDLGANWVNQRNSLTNYDIYNIYFTNSYKGYIVGANGFLASTTNNGNNWITVNTNYNSFGFNDCCFINELTGFLAGTNGLILRTSNAGSNWSNVGSSSSYNNSSIKFIDNLTGFVTGQYFNFGYYGNILRTTNSGTSWNSILQVPYNLYYIEFINANTGFITGQNGNLLKSTNSGNNWIVIPFGNNTYLNSIYFYDSLNGFIGCSGKLLKTIDGGNIWTETHFQNVNYSFGVKGIDFINNNTGYFLSVCYCDYYNKSGDIFKTTDGGSNWYHLSELNYLPFIINRGLNNIHFINDTLGYIVGDKGLLFKTTNGGNPIGIETVSNEIPNSCSLHQNYPNPFNPNTKIKFDLPADVGTVPRTVRLIIYDVLGREVATLFNEQLKPGSYEVEWEGSNNASGVYFYSLQTESFTQTKKLVLLK